MATLPHISGFQATGPRRTPLREEGVLEEISAAPLVAALGLSPEPGDVAGNLRLADGAIRAAKRDHPGLRWVVLPELFTCAYSDLASVRRYAEDARSGSSARSFSSLARELGLYVAYGFPELVREGVRDAVNLVGPEGVLVTYGKSTS